MPDVIAIFTAPFRGYFFAPNGLVSKEDASGQRYRAKMFERIISLKMFLFHYTEQMFTWYMKSVYIQGKI